MTCALITKNPVLGPFGEVFRALQIRALQNCLTVWVLQICRNYSVRPHPKSLSQAGRGTLKGFTTPLLPFWEKGLGDEGRSQPE